MDAPPRAESPGDEEEVGSGVPEKNSRTPKNRSALALEILISGLLACALTILFHHRIVFSGETFQMAGALGPFPADPGLRRPVKDPLASSGQFEPWLDHTLRERERHGGTPLWNPYQGLGAPHLANMQTAVWHPLRYVQEHLPERWRFDFAVLARFAFGLWGMYLLARLLGLDRLPSLLSGVGFAFAGYFLFFANMVHLNVEYLLPWHLIGIELAFLGFLRRGALLFLASVWLSHAGGFPESTALAMFVALLYGLFRLACPARPEVSRTAASKHLALAALLGTLLAAPLILPFLEFLEHSVHLHSSDRMVGMTAFQWDKAFALFVPHMERFGTGLNGPYSFNEPPYVGLVTAVFAFFGTVSLLFRRSFDRVTAFFAVFTALTVLKWFDAPYVRHVGTWPILDQIIFRKYLGPVVAFSFAFLAGRGLHVFARWERSRPWLLAATGLAVWMFLHELYDQALPDRPDPAWWHATPTLVLLALSLLSLILFFLPRWLAWRPLAVVLSAAIVVLAFGELHRYAPAKRGKREAALANPLGLGAFVHELRERRILGTHGVLPPNWATRYEIQDARLLDAIVDASYRNLIDALFSMPLRDRWDGPRRDQARLNLDGLDVLGIEYLIATRDWLHELEKPPLEVAVAPEVGDPRWKRDDGTLRLEVNASGRVFLGPFVVPQQGSTKVHLQGAFEAGAPPEARLLELGPARPVFDTGDRTLETLSRSYPNRIATVRIDERAGTLEPDLFANHPGTLIEVRPALEGRLVPGARLSLRNVSWAGERLTEEAFRASQLLPADLVPEASGLEPVHHAPVPLRLLFESTARPAFATDLSFQFDFGEQVPKTANARIQVLAHPVLAREEAPAPRPTPLGLELDLASHRGRRLLLELQVPSTRDTPIRLRDARLADQSFRFRAVREEPLLVLENRLAHPRAYLVHEAEVVDEAQLSRKLRAPDLDPRRVALVSGEHARPLSSSSPRGEPRVRVERPSSDRLRLEIAPESDALLVVLETYAPGWRAKVDGREVPVVRVLSAFRGVYVHDGDRIVEMFYAPRSHFHGRLLTSLGLFILVLYAFWPLVRRPRNAPCPN